MVVWACLCVGGASENFLLKTRYINSLFDFLIWFDGMVWHIAVWHNTCWCWQDLAQLQEAARCLIGFRESREIDPEAFGRLIYVARSVAAFRPTNLVLFAEKYFMTAMSGVLSLSHLKCSLLCHPWRRSEKVLLSAECVWSLSYFSDLTRLSCNYHKHMCTGCGIKKQPPKKNWITQKWCN